MPTQLPGELLLHIFSDYSIAFGEYLEDDEVLDRQDFLARLCLVSKTFCRLAQPLLYSSFRDHFQERALPTLWHRITSFAGCVSTQSSGDLVESLDLYAKSGCQGFGARYGGVYVGSNARCSTAPDH